MPTALSRTREPPREDSGSGSGSSGSADDGDTPGTRTANTATLFFIGGPGSESPEREVRRGRILPLRIAKKQKRGRRDDMADAGAAAAGGAAPPLPLLSRLLPPSHVLPDGRTVRLPPPTDRERSSFFERAVAAERLIPVDGEDDGKRRREGGEATDGAEEDGRKRRKADSTRLHPLAVASARLRSQGIDEMSKAINLANLVAGGEYLGLTNVVERNPGGVESEDGAADAQAEGGSAAGPPGRAGEDGAAALDRRLRARYVLRGRRAQYSSASAVLARHGRRLASSVSARRILDGRLRSLRRRWRLAAPEHGTRTLAPVRPREVVAVDIEVYDRGAAAGGGVGRSIGRIARRAPRFATVELDDGYDSKGDAGRLAERVGEIIGGLASDGAGAEGGEVDPAGAEAPPSPTTGRSARFTKAEPFAVADPTLGKVDADFDPDRVPLLTLLFEVGRPSTGFAERWTLSSSSSARPGPDERVIESLQHSLFCASLFESMRAEVIPPPCPSGAAGPAPSSSRPQHRRGGHVAWLSGGTEESFLAAPSVMAGEGGVNGGGEEMRPLSVVHCHEGEVRVQLDDEYSLTVRLVEAGTASAAGSDNNAMDAGTETGSGSQSPAQIRTLCKALLLHSQVLYHGHRTRTRAADAVPDDDGPSFGLERIRTEETVPPPLILQSCVSLGSKLIFERKIRSTLRRLADWLRVDMDRAPGELTVQWLGSNLLDSRSRFTLLFRDLCADVGTDGDALRVTLTSSGGEYRSVGFGSAGELECFVKMEISRSLTRGG